MKFTLLRAKNLIEKIDYATLQHMHELFFFFPTKTQTIYRIQQKLDLACNTVCSSTSIAISGWQHVVQENPCQKHLIFGWIGFIMTFLPSTLSPSFSREAHMWKCSKFCAGGIVMAACSFCLFHQNTMALCLLCSWTCSHHTTGMKPHANKMQSVTMFLACICVVNNVDWIVLHV